MFANRRDMEGECSVCLKKLLRSTADITFCRGGCGQNIHSDCFDQWSKAQQACPLCRVAWVYEDTIPRIEVIGVCTSMMSVYIEWLYTKKDYLEYHLDYSESIDMKTFFTRALRLHTIGYEIQDESFLHLICQGIAQGWQSENSLNFISQAVKKAELVSFIKAIYSDWRIRRTSKAFFVRGLVPLIKLENISGKNLPQHFWEDLAAVSLGSMSMERVYAEWLPDASDSDDNSDPDASDPDDDPNPDAETDEEMET